MTRKKAMVSLTGQTVEDMRVIGRMVNSMEMECTPQHLVKSNTAFGKMEKDLNGSTKKMHLKKIWSEKTIQMWYEKRKLFMIGFHRTADFRLL